MKKIFSILIIILLITISCKKEDSQNPLIGKYQVEYFVSSTGSFDSTYSENTANIVIEVKNNPSSTNQYFIFFPEDELSDFDNTNVELSSFKSPILNENNDIIIGKIIAYHSGVDGFIKNGSIYIRDVGGCCGNFYTKKIQGSKIQ